MWPTVPTLRTPDDGASVSTGVVSWAPMAGAQRYYVQTAAPGDPSFTNPTDHGWFSEPFTTLPTDGGSFRWRVRGWANGGYSAWSPGRSVTVDAGADPAPDPEDPAPLPPVVLHGPADGATNVDLATTPIDWDTEAGVRYYDLQVQPVELPWTDPSPVDFPPRVGPRIGPLNAGTTYEWRMRANDTDGVLDVGPWSEDRTFSTPAAKPVALLSPADGATVASETTVFRWTTTSDAPVGWLEFSRTPDFADPVREVETAEGAVTPRRLRPGLWYWRVNAGRGTWITASSPVRTVNVLDTVHRPPSGSATDPACTARSRSTAQRRTRSARWPRWRPHPTGSPGPSSHSRDGMLDVSEPAFGGTTPGPRTVWVRWQDDSGNWSVPFVSTVWYGMTAPADTDLPTVSGIRAVGVVPGSQASAGGRVPIRTSWTGTDGTTFVRTYNYSVNSDVDPPTAEATGHDVATPGADVYLPTGRRHRLTIRAIDATGNVGPFATGPYFRTTRYDETSSAITYRGTWATGTSSTYWLGKAKASSSRGATATLAVTARSMARFSVRAPTRGGATTTSTAC